MRTNPQPKKDHATSGTIDISMTWTQAARALLLVLEAGTEEGKQEAREMVLNMAAVADSKIIHLISKPN